MKNIIFYARDTLKCARAGPRPLHQEGRGLAPTTIPGVGYYIALLVKAEVEDISRFSSGD